MKTRSLLAILAAAWALAPIAGGAERDRKAPDSLQGSWEVVKADAGFDALRLTFHGDTVTAEFKDPLEGGKVAHFTIDPTARPATIDVLAGEKKNPGIYEVNGDTLKLCLAQKEGTERPRRLESAPGVMLVTLKRVRGPRTLTLEYALGMLPQASSISSADFKAMSDTSAPQPSKIKDQSLSLVLFSLDPREADKNPEAKKDFQFLGEGIPQPAHIGLAMSLSQQKGYFSFLQPEYFTQATIDAGEDRAQGTVSFRCKGLYEGAVEYRAEKQVVGWVITEFRLPHYGVRVARNKEGLWEQARIKSEK